MTGPYVGPRPFGWGDKEDADRFFGRDREASELRFRVHANPVLLLYAQSGAGKTSLLNAKLVPELTKDGFCVLPPVRIRTFQREEDETAIRDTTYLQRVTQAWKQLAAQPETPKELFPLFLRERLTNPKNEGDNLGKLLLDETGKSKFVLVFDQFEELFAPGVSNAEHQINFFGQIADCVQNNPSVRFVFALRSEWLAVFDKCANQIPTPMRSRFYLEQLKKDAAEQAIIKPVE